MRVIKGIVLVCFCSIALSACFEPPDFGDSPRIDFKKIEFRDVEGASEEVILYIDFKDGDGDLGLSTLGDTDSPFHREYYYLHNGIGDTIPIIPERIEQGGVIYTMLNYCPPGSSTTPSDPNYCVRLPGKIVTNKTRNLPAYGYLPIYNPNSNCPPYQTITTIIGDDGLPVPGVLAPLSSVDNTYAIKDTLTFSGVQYALISDLLLYKVNPNTNNIEVRFWQFENGEYVEYQFPGCQNYFGRFETSITDTYAGRPIEGTIRYTMENSSFLATFGSRSIKVSVRIRDRALNVSNTVESPIFELNEVRVD